MTRYRVRGKRLILGYHGIIPTGEAPAGERTLFISQRDFAVQLDMLAGEADVVPLDRIDEDGDGRPRIAITFDDAYAGAVVQGVEELARRGMPATFFVVPGRLDGHVFWWDALAHAEECLNPNVREYALRELEGSDEKVRTWAAAAALSVHSAIPAYARTATLSELRAALRYPGITVGSHTWSHPNLASLGERELVAEITQSRDWLRAEFGHKALNWLAYPYGIDSSRVRQAVADASYAGALRIDGGWHRPAEVSRYARPRLSIGSGFRLRGLRSRINGVRLT